MTVFRLARKAVFAFFEIKNAMRKVLIGLIAVCCCAGAGTPEEFIAPTICGNISSVTSSDPPTSIPQTMPIVSRTQYFLV